MSERSFFVSLYLQTLFLYSRRRREIRLQVSSECQALTILEGVLLWHILSILFNPLLVEEPCMVTSTGLLLRAGI